MSLSQVHIFAKNRDAAAPLKGYEFQHLKTMETWLLNRVNNINEVIYCDREEDIFQRDLNTGNVTLRQLKLYSSNFSFSTDAIQDALSNFFMLFVKGDFMFTDVRFSFETNSSVAGRDVKGNDADLLREWSQQEGEIPEELLNRIRVRVHRIIATYIEQEYANKVENVELKPEVQKAINVFNQITDDVLNSFIRSISWKFGGVDPDTALEAQRTLVKNLISQIPLPVDIDNEVAFSLLYREIVTRSTASNPEDRGLTNERIDFLLLAAGDEEDKAYGEVYEKWLKAEDVERINLGQFYEIIDAVRYFRMNIHESGHNVLWERLLRKYIATDSVKVHNKRKAIYELSMIKFTPIVKGDMNIGSLSGDEDLIRYYFDHWKDFYVIEEIKESIILLQIVLAQALKKSVSIDVEEVNAWIESVRAFLNDAITTEADTDAKCKFIELRGTLEFLLHDSIAVDEIHNAIGYYRQIIHLLPNAITYSVASLFNELKDMVKAFISFSVDHSLIIPIEEFSDELQEEAAKLGQRHIAAKGLVSIGVTYLKAGGLQYFLNALNCFHKASELWFLEDTKEGYILALINISQVYYSLRMTFAGKYYALCAIWATWHFKVESLYHRLITATGLLVYGNFMHGAWSAALDDFNRYMASRQDFNTGPWYADDKMFGHTLGDVAFIIFASRRLKPEMGVYLNVTTQGWGDLWGILQTMIEKLEEMHPKDESVLATARKKMVAEPLNDIGAEREIRFNALNVNWNIKFNNTYTLNAIGEEFLCSLQIHLCEIARVKPDFIKPGITDVFIQVIEGAEYVPIQSNDGIHWKISIPKFTAKDNQAMRYHGAFIGIGLKEIFRPLSGYDDAALDHFWTDILLKKEKVGHKALATNNYQKVFYNATDEAEFVSSQRSAFASLPSGLVFKQLPPLLVE